MRRAAAALALVLAACGPPGGRGPDRPAEAGAAPPAPVLGSAVPAGHTRWSNESIANAFVRLTHGLEWGLNRPHLVRYEDPVRVGVSGAGAAPYRAFLADYLESLRAGSGLDIAEADGPANLLINFVPGRDFRGIDALGRHSCVVAPGRLGWEEFRDDPVRHGTRAFESQRAIEAMSIYIPDNAPPYLIRTCLIEEIAQALGPANDLYGLGPSIFNDDAAHIFPTRLDQLMLSLLYRPEMRTGMGAQETRERARALLDALNPEGRNAPPLPPLIGRDLARWRTALQEGFDRSRSRAARDESLEEALEIAETRARGTAYHCHSLTVLARIRAHDPEAALRTLERAEPVCAGAHGTGDIRLARLGVERARALYRLGRASHAWGASEGLEAPLAAHGHAERLVALYALQAAALREIQQPAAAARAQALAVAWGAYALGRDHPDVRRLASD